MTTIFILRIIRELIFLLFIKKQALYNFSVTYSVDETVSDKIVIGVWGGRLQELLRSQTHILRSPLRYNQHQLDPV